MVIKNMGFVVKLCGSKSWFSLLAAVLSWENPLTSLCLSFLEIGANNNTDLAGLLRGFNKRIKLCIWLEKGLAPGKQLKKSLLFSNIFFSSKSTIARTSLVA